VLGEAVSSFIPHAYEIPPSELRLDGDNVLEVRFESALDYVKR
jgi:hypothetical protein